MNESNFFRALIVTIFLIAPVICYAQRIDNVHPEIEGEKIHIYYDCCIKL